MSAYSVFPLGEVVPFVFETSINGVLTTITDLAAADIEVYKGTSMTQRASDAGFALLDTDGIDLDGIVGVHGISIDTGDNTDAGFYVAGSLYTVRVGPFTLSGATQHLIVGRFRLVAAEATAGVPVANVTHVGGTLQTAGDIIGDTNDVQARLPAALGANGNLKADVRDYNGVAGTFASGRPEVNTSHLAGGSTAATNLRRSAEAMYVGTVSSGTSTTIVDSGLTEADTDHWKGRIVIFLTGALAKQATDITAFTPGTDTLTVTALTNAPSNGDTYVIV